MAVEEKGLIYSKRMPAKGHSPPIPGGHSLDCVEHGEGQGKDRWGPCQHKEEDSTASPFPETTAVEFQNLPASWEP